MLISFFSFSPLFLKNTFFQQTMNKRWENHRSQEDKLTHGSTLFIFLQNKLINPRHRGRNHAANVFCSFSVFDSWCCFIFVFAFLPSPFPETFMEWRVPHTEIWKAGRSGPFSTLHPCSLIIFTVIYWLFCSAEAGSLSKSSDINNSAVLGSHKDALLRNYQPLYCPGIVS